MPSSPKSVSLASARRESVEIQGNVCRKIGVFMSSNVSMFVMDLSYGFEIGA
jgi:hypothetical protein